MAAAVESPSSPPAAAAADGTAKTEPVAPGVTGRPLSQRSESSHPPAAASASDRPTTSGKPPASAEQPNSSTPSKKPDPTKPAEDTQPTSSDPTVPNATHRSTSKKSPRQAKRDRQVEAALKSRAPIQPRVLSEQELREREYLWNPPKSDMDARLEHLKMPMLQRSSPPAAAAAVAGTVSPRQRWPQISHIPEIRSAAAIWLDGSKKGFDAADPLSKEPFIIPSALVQPRITENPPLPPVRSSPTKGSTNGGSKTASLTPRVPFGSSSTRGSPGGLRTTVSNDTVMRPAQPGSKTSRGQASRDSHSKAATAA